MTIILKARQLGITTFFCIFFLDQVLFSKNKTAGIIAHKDKDAKKIFKDKVKFAWDNLPQVLKDTLGPPNADSVGELSFPNGSTIFVSTSTRSGTIQFLHISEFGYICSHFPNKADEIVAGSINSVEQGQIITIESTADGKGGAFYEFCTDALAKQKAGKRLSSLEFKFFFFPWWQHPEYTIESEIVINKEMREYFDKLRDTHGILLTPGQRSWYVLKKKMNGDKMFSEYPSIPEEAFLASIQGAYYAREMVKVHEEKRILNIPYDNTIPVETWWDLGMNDKNVIIFTQAFSSEIRIIDYYENSGEGLAHYIKVLQDKGYIYGKHTFPHDINVKELGSGKSRYQTLVDLNLRNIRTVTRTPSIVDDIEAVRRIFGRFYFDEVKTSKLVDSLGSYRRELNEKTGEFTNTPRHDEHSHAADALRTLARGWNQHGLSTVGMSNEVAMSDFF